MFGPGPANGAKLGERAQERLDVGLVYLGVPLNKFPGIVRPTQERLFLVRLNREPVNLFRLEIVNRQALPL